MSDYSYEFPDAAGFIYTLRLYLKNAGHEEISSLLSRSECHFSSSSSYTQVEWNTYWMYIDFLVPVAELPKFTDEVKKIMREASAKILPPNTGFLLDFISVAPFIEAPPDDEQPIANNGSLGSLGAIEHDNLRFRSKTEIKIYEALKRHSVLFFPNAAAVLGGKNEKREPDFLICKDGKWGVLEVMGDWYHPAKTAMRDHDRARLFKDYGLICFEFYDAKECYNNPDEVVRRFLELLDRSYKI